MANFPRPEEGIVLTHFVVCRSGRTPNSEPPCAVPWPSEVAGLVAAGTAPRRGIDG